MSQIACVRSTKSPQQNECFTHWIHILYQNLKQYPQVFICSICSHYTALKWHSQFIQINFKCHFLLQVSYIRMTHPDSVWVKNLIHKFFCKARLQSVGPHLSASVIFHHNSCYIILPLATLLLMLFIGVQVWKVLSLPLFQHDSVAQEARSVPSNNVLLPTWN